MGIYYKLGIFYMNETDFNKLREAQEAALKKIREGKNHPTPDLPKVDDEKLKRDLAHKRVEKPGA